VKSKELQIDKEPDDDYEEEKEYDLDDFLDNPEHQPGKDHRRDSKSDEFEFLHVAARSPLL
jgi:hypothetical protein